MRVINLVIKTSLYVTMATVIAMMLLNVADVFMRYVFNKPIAGTMEMVELMMVCLLMAMAATAMDQQHVKVDVIISRLPTRVVKLLEVITMIIGIILSVILVRQAYLHGLFVREYQLSTSMLHIPVFPFYIVLGVSFVFLIIAMIFLVVKRTMELFR